MPGNCIFIARPCKVTGREGELCPGCESMPNIAALSILSSFEILMTSRMSRSEWSVPCHVPVTSSANSALGCVTMKATVNMKIHVFTGVISLLAHHRENGHSRNPLYLPEGVGAYIV